MERAGLLYCYNHEEPWKLSALNRERRWACRYHHRLGPGAPCLQIADHILTPPLTRESLACLDLTPHAKAVLEKLKSEVSQHSLEETQRRRREAELKAHIANLERYLGSGDPEREETYWRLIREAKAQLDLMRQKPPTPRATPLDLERVAHFLENIGCEWDRYPSRLRNRLLKLLVDRVELRHDTSRIEATIVWKVGFRQVLRIKRPPTNYSREKLWRQDEDSLLRMLWPSSSPEAIMAAFPRRTWTAVNLRASRLKINREWVRVGFQKGRRWTNEEKVKLKELYCREANVDDIARELQRSRATITSMAHIMGLSSPKELRYRKREPVCESLNIKLFQESSSPN